MFMAGKHIVWLIGVLSFIGQSEYTSHNNSTKTGHWPAAATSAPTISPSMYETGNFAST
jgi:hypothetical protein